MQRQLCSFERLVKGQKICKNFTNACEIIKRQFNTRVKVESLDIWQRQVKLTININFTQFLETHLILPP